MSQPPIILLVYRPGDDIQEIVTAAREIAPKYDVQAILNSETISDELLDRIEIAAAFRFPKALINSPTLRWYHHNAAGVDWVLQYENRERFQFEITNISGMHAVQITEHIFGFIHTLNRDMMEFHVSKTKGTWKKPRIERIQTLPGKTILIVGLGKIGTRITQIAKAHDMRVIGIRRSKHNTNSNVDKTGTLDDLPGFISEADIIVSCLPNTEATQCIFNAREFGLMKRSALFINIGRGVHVDESALIQALNTQSIRGAALDAVRDEPLAQGSPLWKTPNLIISPHSSGVLPNYAVHAYQYFLRNLKKYIDQQPLENRINKKLGY